MATGNHPAILSIHAEPDKPFFGEGLVGDADRWHGFEAGVRRVRELRQKFGASFRVHWLIRLDPQIAGIYGSSEWGFNQYRSDIEELLEAGDHFGLHVHTHRLEHPGRGWVLGVEDHEWQYHCIQSAHDNFTECFGRAPESIAVGSNILSQPIADFLVELGFRYDMTTVARTPKMRFNKNLQADGEQPDYSRINQLPYRASNRDFLTPGDGPLWILPTSSVPSQPTDKPREREAGNAQTPPYTRLRLLKGSEGIDRAIDRMEADGVTPFLHFACRSKFFSRMDAIPNLEAIITACLDRNFRFVTAEEAVAPYQAEQPQERDAGGGTPTR